MCGTSQRFPPAHFSGGLGILLAFKVGAGGETRTLMSVTSPDFESGAYTNFATPAWIVGADAILVEATRRGQTSHLASKHVLNISKNPLNSPGNLT